MKPNPEPKIAAVAAVVLEAAVVAAAVLEAAVVAAVVAAAVAAAVVAAAVAAIGIVDAGAGNQERIEIRQSLIPTLQSPIVLAR